MKAVSELLKQTYFSDEELSIVIKHLVLAIKSLEPLGDHYAVAIYCLRMDLNSFVSIALGRGWHDPENGIIKRPKLETGIGHIIDPHEIWNDAAFK